MEDNTQTFGGFTALLTRTEAEPDTDDSLDSFLDQSLLDSGNGDDVDNLDTDIVDPSSITDDTDTDDKTDDKDDKDIVDPKTVKKDLDDSTDDVDNNDDTDDDVDNSTDYVSYVDILSESEPEIAAFVQEKLYEKFGWSFDESEEKVKSIDAIADYLQEIVEQNSQPVYANEEIANLNKFVQEGGSLEKYFETKYANGFDVAKADLKSEIDQKRILTEYFKEQGYTDDRISKRLQRYEEIGVMEEEAQDAQELLKNIQEKKAQKLLKEQEKQQEALLEQQQKFYDNVISDIDSTKNIIGIELTPVEKAKLKDYIFKVESDGKTRFAKDYQQNNSSLIKSAYLTMIGDKIQDRVKGKAVSDATKTLKKKLESVKNSNRLKGLSDEPASGSKVKTKAFDSFTTLLSKPTF